MFKNAFLLLLLAGSSLAWWDASFPYRTQVNISSSAPLSDYQVNLSLNTQALIAAGRMRSDCADLRLLAEDDSTQLPFWVEGGCNTPTTKIWVKAPLIPTGISTMYVYYGNLSAASLSNYFSVFDALGDGSSGALTVSSANTIVNTYAYLTGNESAGDSAIAINDGSGFSNGDEILLIQMQNYAGGTAGTYEFRKISSGGGTTSFTLNAPLKNSYASGAFNSTTSTATQVVRVPQYTTVTVNNGASIIPSAWNGYTGGIVAFKANSTLTIASGGTISAVAKGFRAGPICCVDYGLINGYQGEGYKGKGAYAQTATPEGGGGAGKLCGPSNTAGGGGGSYATAGASGYIQGSCQLGSGATAIFGSSDLSVLFFGGAAGVGYAGPEGNSGGGIILLNANSLSNSGTITAGGSAGGGVVAPSGAGAGGSISITARTLTTGNNILALPGPAAIGGAGAGGNGRIRLSSNSITGTSNPSAYTSGFDTEHNRKYASTEPTSAPGQEEEMLLQFAYRQQVIISNGGLVLSDYQVNLTANTSALVAAGKMKSDCSDLRFTDSTSYNTQDWTAKYSYWIESGCNTGATKIWVKVPSIPNGTSTMYMYYGNSDAVAKSRYSDVFLSAAGGNISYSGDHTIHAFLTNGTFTPYFNGAADVVVIGGGGSGSGSYVGGCGCIGPAGGSGGVNISTAALTNGTSVTVTVGAGGIGIGVGCGVNPPGRTGGSSSFGTMAATGGPGGGSGAPLGSPGGFAGGSPSGCLSNGEVGPGGAGTAGNGSAGAGGIGGGGNGYGGAGGYQADGGFAGGGGSSGWSGIAGKNGANGIVVVKYLNRLIASPEPTATTSQEQLPDTIAPSVQIQSPISQAYNTSTVNVNFTAIDNVGVSSCTVRLNGTVNSSICGNYSITLSNGAYNLTVTSNDTSGNVNSSQVLFTVAIPTGQSTNTTQASTGADGVAAGTIGFTFIPTSLQVQAGGQTVSKPITASAGVNRITVATRITLQGQPVQNKQVTYTLSGAS